MFVVLPAMSERRFAPVEVRGRWWNGAWGRMARRDIWLVFNGRLWRARGRLGGDAGEEVTYDFPDEASARSMVDRMMKTSAGTWRDLTGAVRQDATAGGLTSGAGRCW